MVVGYEASEPVSAVLDWGFGGPGEHQLQFPGPATQGTLKLVLTTTIRAVSMQVTGQSADGRTETSDTLSARRLVRRVVLEVQALTLDIPNGTGGLATSSTQHRQWLHEGAPVHHILDPRPGRPVDTPLVSATVQAASCVEANAASTAAIILGEGAAAWLEQRGVAALLIDRDGRSTRCGAWPAAELTRAPAVERMGAPC